METLGVDVKRREPLPLRRDGSRHGDARNDLPLVHSRQNVVLPEPATQRV